MFLRATTPKKDGKRATLGTLSRTGAETFLDLDDALSLAKLPATGVSKLLTHSAARVRTTLLSSDLTTVCAGARATVDAGWVTRAVCAVTHWTHTRGT